MFSSVDTWQTQKHLINLSLEDLWCTRYAERQFVETESSKGCNECCQQFGFIGKEDLPEPAICIPSLLKSFAPDSCTRVVSTLGIGWTSRKIFLLSGLRSTQIRLPLSPLEPQPLQRTRVWALVQVILPPYFVSAVATSDTMYNNGACAIHIYIFQI